MLGDLLVARGVVVRAHVDEALELQKTRRERLGELLCGLGYLDAPALRTTLAEQAGIEIIDLQTRQPDAQALALVPIAIAGRYQVLPVALS